MSTYQPPPSPGDPKPGGSPGPAPYGPTPAFGQHAPGQAPGQAGMTGRSASPYGPPPQGQPLPGPAPKTHKQRKPRTALVASLTGVLGLFFGVVIGAGVSGEDEGVNTVPAPTPADEREDERDQDDGVVDAAASQDSADADDHQHEDPDPTETAEPDEDPTTAAAEQGTRENPHPIGAEVFNDDWTVVLGEPHEAWDVISAENQFNDPPEEGFEHYLVPMTATYTGDETGQAGWDLTVEFVGSDGVTYDDCWEVIPDPIRDVGELYDGGVAEGNVCLTVPAGADGLWTVTAGWFSEPAFFEVGE